MLPPNAYAETLTRALSSSVDDTWRYEEGSRVCQVSTQQEGGHLQARKRVLTRNQVVSNLDLRPPRLQNREKINFCCSRHSVYGVLL